MQMPQVTNHPLAVWPILQTKCGWSHSRLLPIHPDREFCFLPAQLTVKLFYDQNQVQFLQIQTEDLAVNTGAAEGGHHWRDDSGAWTWNFITISHGHVWTSEPGRVQVWALSHDTCWHAAQPHFWPMSPNARTWSQSTLVVCSMDGEEKWWQTRM